MKLHTRVALGGGARAARAARRAPTNGQVAARAARDMNDARSEGTKGPGNGDYTQRLKAFGKWPGGLVHGYGAHRPAICSSKSGPRRWRKRHLRTGSPHGVAHPSARTNADRHLRLRVGATRGWPDRGNQARRYRLVSARREA